MSYPERIPPDVTEAGPQPAVELIEREDDDLFDMRYYPEVYDA